MNFRFLTVVLFIIILTCCGQRKNESGDSENVETELETGMPEVQTEILQAVNTLLLF
jgi:hypothetical protein